MLRARRPDVVLSTVERVRHVLERAKVPLSRNEILRLLHASGHATTRQRLNRALAFFFDLEVAIEGPKGVQWTRSESESLRRAVHTGRRL